MLLTLFMALSLLSLQLLEAFILLAFHIHLFIWLYFFQESKQHLFQCITQYLWLVDRYLLIPPILEGLNISPLLFPFSPLPAPSAISYYALWDGRQRRELASPPWSYRHPSVPVASIDTNVSSVCSWHIMRLVLSAVCFLHWTIASFMYRSIAHSGSHRSATLNCCRCISEHAIFECFLLILGNECTWVDPQWGERTFQAWTSLCKEGFLDSVKDVYDYKIYWRTRN